MNIAIAAVFMTTYVAIVRHWWMRPAGDETNTNELIWFGARQFLAALSMSMIAVATAPTFVMITVVPAMALGVYLGRRASSALPVARWHRRRPRNDRY